MNEEAVEKPEKQRNDVGFLFVLFLIDIFNFLLLGDDTGERSMGRDWGHGIGAHDVKFSKKITLKNGTMWYSMIE